MDDDPWISWKMAQTVMNCIDRGSHTKKPKGPTAIRKATLALRVSFFFLFFSSSFFGRGRIWWCSGEAKTCRVSTLAKSTAN